MRISIGSAAVTRDVGAILHSAEAGEWLTVDELRYRLVPTPRRRLIESALEELRLTGHPIIAGTEGVRLGLDAAEVREYATGRRRRLVSIAKGTRALLTTARHMEDRAASIERPTLWKGAA